MSNLEREVKFYYESIPSLKLEREVNFHCYSSNLSFERRVRFSPRILRQLAKKKLVVEREVNLCYSFSRKLEQEGLSDEKAIDDL